MKDRYFVNRSLLGMEGKEYPSQEAAVAAMKEGDVLHVQLANGKYCRHMTKDYLDHMEKMLSEAKEDAYYEALGKLVEERPICSPRVRRG